MVNAVDLRKLYRFQRILCVRLSCNVLKHCHACHLSPLLKCRSVSGSVVVTARMNSLLSSRGHEGCGLLVEAFVLNVDELPSAVDRGRFRGEKENLGALAC